MKFPLSFNDLSLWLAVNAIVLLVTSELLFSSLPFSENLVLEKKKIRLVAIGLGMSFMATVVIRIVRPL